MAAVRGEYHDAIHVKKNKLLLLVSEVFGGVNGAALEYLRRLAAAAGAEGGVDTTAYSTRHAWRLSFFEHHARRLSAAVALGDAAVLVGGMASFVAQATRDALAAEAALVTVEPLPWPPLPAAACDATPPSTLPSAARRA